jgi:hypothetical protein
MTERKRTLQQTNSEYNRRDVIRTLGTGTLLVGASSVGTAHSDAHVSLSYGFGHTRIRDGDYHAAGITLSAENLALGSAHTLRVTDGEGQSVTVTAEEETTISDLFFMEIYDARGRIRDDPQLHLRDGEIPVRISGDTGMFEAPPIFSKYSVDALEGSEVVASTEERFQGIGYKGTAEQETTDGVTEVRFPLADEGEESWAVVLSISNIHEDGLIRRQLRSEFEQTDGELVTQFQPGELDPVPEGGSRAVSVNFYVTGDPDSGPPNLSIPVDVEIVGSPEPEILGVTTPSGRLQPGSVMTSSVTLVNTGPIEGTYSLAYSVIAPDNRPFTEGTTGEVTVASGANRTVEITWEVPEEAPRGGYDLIISLRKTNTTESSEPLATVRKPSAFTLDEGALPVGADVLSPVVPDSFPYTDTHSLHVPEFGAYGDGIEGESVSISVDRQWKTDNLLEVTVRIERPRGRMLERLLGDGDSQLFVLYNDTHLSVAPDGLESRTATTDFEDIAPEQVISPVAGLGDGETIKDLLRSGMAATTDPTRAWATTAVEMNLPQALSDPADVSVVRLDFTQPTLPESEGSAEINSYELRATFRSEEPVEESALAVLPNLRGFTIPLPHPDTETVTVPVEYRRQVTVPVTSPSVAATRAPTETGGSSGTTTETDDEESESDGVGPGFGILGALGGLGGAGYLLKRRVGSDEQ